MASTVSRTGVRQVKPLLSIDRSEARRRVLNLYRAWYKHIPYMVLGFDIPKNEVQCKRKLREEFEKHRHVTDIRVIDMLVLKGQNELQEVVNKWKQGPHVMAYWKDTREPKPKDFLSKFITGSQ